MATPSSSSQSTNEPSTQRRRSPSEHRGGDPKSLTVATVAIADDDLAAIAQTMSIAAASGTQLVVLPELAGHPAGIVGRSATERPEKAVATSDAAVRTIRDAISGTLTTAITTVVDVFGGAICHTAVAITADGISFRQRQLSIDPRWSWQRTHGDEIEFFDRDWGRLVVLCGRDAVEARRHQTALGLGADVLAIPFAPLGPNEPMLDLDGSAPTTTVVSCRASDGQRSAIRWFDGEEHVVHPEGAQPLGWATITRRHAAL